LRPRLLSEAEPLGGRRDFGSFGRDLGSRQGRAAAGVNLGCIGFCDLENELIPASRNSDDGISAEQLTKRRNLHLQIVLFNYHTGPCDIHQLVFGDHPVTVLNQREENIERAPAEGDWTVMAKQRALGYPHLNLGKAVYAGHRFLLKRRSKWHSDRPSGAF